MTTIQITRPNEWTNRIRKYKIFLDNNEAGVISNNSTLDLYVPEGKHVLFAKMGWYSSQKLEIEIKEEEVKYVKVSCGAFTKMLPFLAIPFFILAFLAKAFFQQDIRLFLLAPILLMAIYMLTLGRKKYLDIKEF